MDDSTQALLLTEDDIPGASLIDPLDKHTNQALRWWLLCHGVISKSDYKVHNDFRYVIGKYFLCI